MVTVKMIFHAIEKLRLRHSMGSAKGPRTTNSIANTKPRLSAQLLFRAVVAIGRESSGRESLVGCPQWRQ